MRKFYQNKLWRSKIADLQSQNGAIIHFIPLIDQEYKEELKLKLIEKADDIHTATSEQMMKDEIIDMLEIIDTILASYHISQDEIQSLKIDKIKKFGDYTDLKLIEYAEYPDHSKEALFCAQNADKYPELFEDEHHELTTKKH